MASQMNIRSIRELLSRRQDIRGDVRVDEAEIQAVASDLGVRFPPMLADYLREFGWLGIGADKLFGLGPGVPDYLHIRTITKLEREQSGNPVHWSMIPLHNDGYGNLYCIVVDDSSPAYGNIVVWDHAAGPQQTPDHVADDLEKWLSEMLSSVES